MKPLLRVVNLSKSFGTLPVVQQVSFDVFPGEVVGLTGSIGSGKSVLSLLIAGLHQPDDGSILFKERNLLWPFSCNQYGISVIHQKPSLDDNLDVVSNIFLGNEIGWPHWSGPFKILDHEKMFKKSGAILTQLGLDSGILGERVANLSGEQRQLIAISRSLTRNPLMVIIDEPMVMLSYENQQMLLGLIQNWHKQGVAVLFSSNNLDHLFAVTDRIIILNRGKVVKDFRTDETTRENVVNLLLETGDSPKAAPAIWDYDSYDRLREHAEKLRYHQMLLGKDLTNEPLLNRQLSEQLAEQVQALDQINLTLVEAHRRLIADRELERKHVARELHDQVIQDLLSINYELEEIETRREVSAGLANDFGEVRQSIRDLVDSLRIICGNLRPPTIDSLGLGAALQSYTRDWAARTGIEMKLILDTDLGRLPEATELSIFRILQEGLNNVWRHAQATRVMVSLQHTSPRTLMVSLRDNGIGLNEDFDPLKLAGNGHYGLIGISERVALLGGRFRIQRAPEGGSLLQVEINHPRSEEESMVNSEHSA